MKKIDTKNFRKPTKDEIDDITKRIRTKKMDFYDFGSDIGITCIMFAVIMAAIFLLCQLFSKGIIYTILPLFLIEVGTCSLVGANRAKKELDIFENGEFVVKDGNISEIIKKTCWYQQIKISLSENETEVMKVFGNKFKAGDKVIFAYTENPDKNKWFIPRVFKK